MALYQRSVPYQTADASKVQDESDQEEDTLVKDYQEQVQYDDGGMEDLDRSMSYGGGGAQYQDMQAQLLAASQPLEFGATLETKFASYDNYCNLFHYVLNSEGPVDIDLPNHTWAWDTIDEFIYQFSSFCRLRTSLARSSRPGETLNPEAAALHDNPNTWGCYSVLNVLYSLIQRSEISAQLLSQRQPGAPAPQLSDYAQKPLYRNLGYFSIIGLLRVHCLLGDFSLALKTLDDVELSKKATFARVLPAHFATYYYVGFCYLMLRRYADAIRMFSHILVYVSRTRNLQQKNTSTYDSISKMHDQMLGLVAICVAFVPTKLDDTIHASLRERYGEQLTRLQRGGPESVPVFEDLFRTCCPRFITPTPPDWAHPEQNPDPIDHHTNIFLAEVRATCFNPIVKSYLKLYTTISIAKLAKFCEVKEEELMSWLLVNKQRSRQVRWSEGVLLEGEVVPGGAGELEYAIMGGEVVVGDVRQGRRLVDWYLRNLGRSYGS